MRYCIFLLLLPLNSLSQSYSTRDINRWKQQAQQVTIIRDSFGVPHIYGKSDADAVFGLMYAQCEDDFKRVEMNYIEKLGRLAEIKGESFLHHDLMMRLVIDSAEAVEDYNKSPQWLKKLLHAFADGINYYIYKHPEKPLMLKKFYPWYPMLWTDGSIGAISTGGLTADDVKRFYLSSDSVSYGHILSETENLSPGSNGFAFSPSITASGKSILYINPHVTFYFRPEVHVVSEEGLNVYGAVTWGQFFVYQGFNESCGWMHTSGNTDVADLYAEKISRAKGRLQYHYDGKQKPVTSKKIKLHYHVNGSVHSKIINTYYTHHGPVLSKRGEHWLTLKSNNRSLNGLIQSWQRTKAKSFADYKKTMQLRSNTSNNTVYADREGNIAYWHGNFIPKRDLTYDWTKPVDGTTSATEWKGLHDVRETVHQFNPPNGWLQNCNSTPFTVSGKYSPEKENYPAYMAPDHENFRGINAVRILSGSKDYTIDKVISKGYNTYMAAFSELIPALIKAAGTQDPYDSNSLILPLATLMSWNHHASENSVATTLAIEWATKLLPHFQDTEKEGQVDRVKNLARTAKPEVLVTPLLQVVNELTTKFGTWKIPWGEINRYQRLSGDIDQKFNDDRKSYPVGFASATWGVLPSFSSLYYPGTKKRYGIYGNSFVCAVEFGDKVSAKSLLSGGQSGDPSSPHFEDQAEMYSKGRFKDVLFYKEDVLKHAEKKYHPGE